MPLRRWLKWTLWIVASLALLAVGAAIWFGTQTLSFRDNFSDSVNPWYFVAFYAAAFFLGLIAPSPGGVARPAALLQDLGEVEKCDPARKGERIARNAG